MGHSNQQRPAGHEAVIRIRVLPQLEVSVDRQVLTLKPSSERVVALLALSSRGVRRAAAAATLWPDVSAERAMASLRTALWSLPKSASLVACRVSSMIELTPTVRVDLHEAMHDITALINGTDPDIRRGCPSSLLTGDLLVDWDEPWIEVERERFRQLRLLGLEAFCVLATLRGCYPQAVEAGLAAVSCEPLRERAHLLLMRAHLAEGNRHEAIQQYDHCAALLDRELGLSPSQEMTDLLAAAGGPAASRQGARGAWPGP
jgi:DNA-binding SARP family transcriptional activator